MRGVKEHDTERGRDTEGDNEPLMTMLKMELITLAKPARLRQILTVSN